MTNNKSRKIELTYSILKTIALVGAVASVVILPGLAAAFTPFIKNQQHTKKERVARNRVTYMIWRLKKHGYLKNNANGKLTLTPKGKLLLSRYQLKKQTIKKPRKWDKKWRLVAFDVWETRKSTRDLLRRTLKNFGFVKIQESLWVYPYDCEELVGLLRTDLRLFSAIQYMIVEKMDQDYRLRQHFKLK
jgi:DNA-binding transcriptional regulator PaaX